MSRRSQLAVWSAMVFILALIVASDAIAKPESVLGGILAAYRKQANMKIIEARKLLDDQTYEIVVYQEGRMRMLRHSPGKPVKELVPTKTFNLDKVKEVVSKPNNDAKRAIDILIGFPDLQNVRPIVRAVTLRENTEGKLEFLVHVYMPGVGTYRKSYIVSTDTWQIAKDAIEIDDPREEEWTKEEVPAASAKTEATSGEGSSSEKPAKGKDTTKGDVKKEEPKKDSGAATGKGRTGEKPAAKEKAAGESGAEE